MIFKINIKRGLAFANPLFYIFAFISNYLQVSSWLIPEPAKNLSYPFAQRPHHALNRLLSSLCSPAFSRRRKSELYSSPRAALMSACVMQFWDLRPDHSVPDTDNSVALPVSFSSSFKNAFLIAASRHADRTFDNHDVLFLPHPDMPAYMPSVHRIPRIVTKRVATCTPSAPSFSIWCITSAWS